MDDLERNIYSYKDWLKDVKERIRISRMKIALAANAELIYFYWEMGKDISDKLNNAKWGTKIVEQLSKDLKKEFPDISGLSFTNLYFTKRFYEFYFTYGIVSQSGRELKTADYEQNAIVSQPVTQLQNNTKESDREFVLSILGRLPWGHNRVIISQANSVDEALFYIQKTVESGWSREMLTHQIKLGLYSNVGKSITNFPQTLPNPMSDLVQQTLKDPYYFDFVSLYNDAKERDIELQLVNHITKFILELGKGFAFVGRQFSVQLGDKEYKIDLLFYHVHLKCYVVIELKNKDFAPEHAGKLNFYLTLIDRQVKRDDDNQTIGILLCKGKDNLEVEYALQDIHKPMGVSEFKYTEILPDHIKSSFPTIEEIEEEFKKIDTK